MKGDPNSGTLRVIHERDSNGRTALHLAARSGQEDVASHLTEALIQSHYEVKDKDGRTALHLAAQSGHVGLTLFLVKAWKGGILEEDNKGHTPLKPAIEQGHSEVVRILLNSAVEFDNVGNVLQEAAKWGFKEICELCVERMGGVDWPDENMQTALHHAALGGHYKVVQYLVDCGANTEAEDDSSDSLLWLAAFANKAMVTKVLLRAQRKSERYDNRHSNKRRNEALLRDLAACSTIPGSMDDHINTIRALLDFEVNPNAQDRTSITESQHSIAPQRWERWT